ncbi:MAG: ribosome recycling factor [Candidatus Babeliales bacterium]
MALELILNDSNQKEFDKKMKEELEKCVKHFERELLSIRTGRAHPALVEDIKVNAYGSTLTIRELASISTPEARTIMIQPWDKGVLIDIEKAIAQSDLAITPANDGNILRINLPEMSTQRREELGKILAKKLEEARISVRNVRKDFNNLVKDSLKDKQISEDHSRRLNDSLQKNTDEYIKKCEDLGEKKKQEIMTI